MDKHVVQVEVPKVPRFLSDILGRYQSRNYKQFKGSVNGSLLGYLGTPEENWVLENMKTIDLAITLGVWEVEDEQV
ncbi:hypothetical protein KII97_02460 [Leuconostoc gelidum subsp. gasicomitatum]|uniref:hypothetical protein n=1 Tax=Leuconostoc gasicomitatum TaxID=115778 RepID=UPI001CC795CA|nr:hypothetical protein [Leuconostoc gasicomitatum]MBZ5995370.1 hypothetical protein [Leuconostoc gasicomitatum]